MLEERTDFRRALLAWYSAAQRKLPWRETSDPYAIWISEVMLQQTRVTAVLPYYLRFLKRFPNINVLADAPEEDVLALWCGLGYYSRARNLQRAARQMGVVFPREYDSIRALPGIGDYTAAAIASIAFGLPHAVLDGNVLRVLSRLTNDSGDIRSVATRHRLQRCADSLLDRTHPGAFNQALMELGATLCLPHRPQCLLCPIANYCEARRQGTQHELPVKLRQTESVSLFRTLLLIRRAGKVLMWQRPPSSRLMPGIWELPEDSQVPHAADRNHIGSFRHSITNTRYLLRVMAARVSRKPAKMRFLAVEDGGIPISTMARKALRLAARK